jgi:DNA polymerase III alpha subunit/intein/homing endonuclease
LPSNNKSFVHLHVHADGSALDGLAQVSKMVPRVIELGQTAIGISDHGSMSATYDLYKATKGTGIKPIYGIEAYLAPAVPRTHKEPVRWANGGGDDVSGSGAYTHMTMWAETNEGLHNLFRLSSEAYLTGFYRKPRMDEDLLRLYHKGIIATTGCPSGEVQTWLRIGDYEKAKAAAAKFAEIFGEGNFFVELMDHGLDIEKRVIPQLLQIAKELGLPTVATNDSHYTHKEDAPVHEALLCIGSGSKLTDPDRFKFDGNSYYLKTAEEMRALWDERAPDACDNTVAIAERCSANFEDGLDLMPEFPVPAGETESTWLSKEVERGLNKRYPAEVPEDRKKQAQYEVDVINQMGFPGYFLVTADFINWAKENKIRVGPGRGCLSADTNVLTPFGFKKIKDIAVGDKVYNQNGEIVEVPEIFEYDCDEELIEIKSLYGSAGNKMTSDHKVLIRKADSEIQSWIRADEVEVGDFVLLPRLAEHFLDIASYSSEIVKHTFDTNKDAEEFYIDLLSNKTPAKLSFEDGSWYVEIISSVDGDVEVDSDFIYYRISEVNKVAPEGKVYDFTVPGTHSYVTDSYIVHNSAAGSIVAYAMGITDIDPMKHGLMFERFLNPERVSMPDIDVDFDDRRRGEVIQYVIDKYGSDKVANITTFMGVKAKAAIKDATRVLGLAYMLGDALTKAYPPPIIGRDLSLVDAYNPSNPRYDEAIEFRNLAESTPEHAAIVSLAKGLEGVRRGHGMHAAGVIMSRKPLMETVPLMRRDTNSPVMTQFEYPTCEYLGLLKMDFLGLSNLGTLDEALRLIKLNKNVDVDLEKLGEDLDDTPTFELLSRGETLGVFQLDSPPMRSLLKLMEPDKFEDISAVLALYRPGPMGAGSHIEYAERKNNRRKNTPIHPELEEALEPILGETYGLCLTGDTLIWDADLGKQVRLDSVEDKVKRGKFNTLGIDSDDQVVARKVSYWKDHGIQEVLEVEILNGKKVKITPEHKMLTQDGWKQAKDLVVDVDSFAIPTEGFTDYESKDYIKWVLVKRITHIGFAQVYDIEVEEIHNFIANGIISSNCIYQEQVMKIAQDLAGYSLGKADLLRRAMGKKDAKILAQEFAPFQAGMRANNYSDSAIEALWDVLVPFSDYAFNRAHTAGYGLISYWTAYLKANYPAEYMAALLTTNADNKDKLALYLGECRRMGIQVLSPDVQLSELNYTAVGEDIRVGLIGVKNVGEKVILAWLEKRKLVGAAKSFADFLVKGDGNLATKRSVESLIKAGAFDSFGHPRAALFGIVENSLKLSKRSIKNAEKKEISLFDDDELGFQLEIPEVEEWEKNEKLAFEREMLGLYVSDHPLGEYAQAIGMLSTLSIADLRDAEYPPTDTIKLAGLVVSIERKTTKKAGEPWALVTIEDLDSSISLFVFPKTYSQYQDLLVRDSVLVFTGRAEKRDDGSTSVIIKDISSPNLNLAQRKAERRVERVARGEITEQEAKAMPATRVAIDEGNTNPVIISVDELQLTPAATTRLKDTLLEYNGSRPVHIRMRRVDGSFGLFVLGDDYKVTGTGELAAEIRSIFGSEAV